MTDGIRIHTLGTPSGFWIAGFGISKTNPESAPIPLAFKGKAHVFLDLAHTYDLDKERQNLTVMTSRMGLYTSEQMADDELIFGVDYIREPANKYPACHIHVAGERADLDAVYLGDERSSRLLRQLHIPVGGRRFRPTLEDLVEFVIIEEMAEARDGWQDVIREHRALWEDRQLRAAVRRNQQSAASALERHGWKVTPPDV